jgi:DNA-binding GntR family transcriptional regulator
MSIIPVREAIKRLEAEGLVTIIPHKGAQVTTYDTNEVREVIVVRAILEGYAANSAVGNITKEVLCELQDLNDQMREMAQLGKDEEFVELNTEFHRLIYKQSPYKSLFNMIIDLWEGNNWSKSIFARHNEKMIESVKEHDEIISAIGLKDNDLIEALVRKHKMKNIDYYIVSE